MSSNGAYNDDIFPPLQPPHEPPPTRETWIVIPDWDEFQHYSDRHPVWVKNYTRLMSKDEYRTLTFHQRGVLHSLWMEYARSNRQIRDSTVTLTRQLGQRVTRHTLEALNQAGFIHFSASKPLAPRYPSRTRGEKKELSTSKAVPSSRTEEQRPRNLEIANFLKEMP